MIRYLSNEQPELNRSTKMIHILPLKRRDEWRGNNSPFMLTTSCFHVKKLLHVYACRISWFILSYLFESAYI